MNLSNGVDTTDAVQQRRSFLQKGAIAAAAVATLPLAGSALVGCSESSPNNPDYTKARDISLLTDAYLLEMITINTYLKAMASPALTGLYLELVTSFKDDHVEHAAKIKGILIGDVGGTAPADPAATVTFETGLVDGASTKFKYPPVFGGLTTLGGILKYAVAMELFTAQTHFNYASTSDNSKRLTNSVAVNAASVIAPIDLEHAAAFRLALKQLGSETDKDVVGDLGASVSPAASISLEIPRW